MASALSLTRQNTGQGRHADEKGGHGIVSRAVPETVGALRWGVGPVPNFRWPRRSRDWVVEISFTAVAWYHAGVGEEFPNPKFPTSDQCVLQLKL